MTLKIEPKIISYHFWVLNKVFYASVKSADVLPIANIIATVNTLGEKYWSQLQAQMVTDILPYEIKDYINQNIKAYTRELKIDTVVEEENTENVENNG